MKIYGHYLKLETGDELPVVIARVVATHPDGMASLKLNDTTVVHIKFDTSADYLINLGSFCLVAVEFVENPDYSELRETQGPKIIPCVVAVGKLSGEIMGDLIEVTQITQIG